MFLSLVLVSFLTQPFGADAPATCRVLYTGETDRYEFVRIQEVSTGRIVLQSPIKAGDMRDVHVGSALIKVEHKWAGDLDYRTMMAKCEGGNTIEIRSP